MLAAGVTDVIRKTSYKEITSKPIALNSAKSSVNNEGYKVSWVLIRQNYSTKVEAVVNCLINMHLQASYTYLINMHLQAAYTLCACPENHVLDEQELHPSMYPRKIEYVLPSTAELDALEDSDDEGGAAGQF
ncbi:hypothetical protein GH733_015237 [Mirounga leonina]|nr:hypothetical protein GH733_015237 [Mirounga leonina]